MLSAMANPKRLLVLCSLVEQQRSVGELAELVGLSDAALSQHLSKMRALNLVRSRRDGQTIYYTLASGDVRAVLETLHQRFCENRPWNGTCRTFRSKLRGSAFADATLVVQLLAGAICA